MSSDELISKEELLVGMPAKKTKALLFLIEKQSALLAQRSQVNFTFADDSQSDRDLAYFKAFAIDNSQMPPVRIQHLERFAAEWSILVPDNLQRQAALLQTLAEKYNFTQASIPNIRQILDWERPEFRQTYYKLYQQPPESAFDTQISLIDRYHWLMYAIAQKLESLPPFWLATLMTIALGLPQAFLALPIATAELGSSVTIILLIVLGGINILTMTCMAEAISRSQDFRLGNTFFKHLAANYLGQIGSSALTVAVSVRVFLIVLACYIGLSTTMANFTAFPATVWAGLLFLLGLYVGSRPCLHLTLGLTIVLAFVNISILLLFSLLCFNHWQLDSLDNLNNLLYLDWNWLQVNSFKPQILHRVFGVTLMLYFSHLYVGECAKIVLPKDPTADSLIGGSIAGTTCLTLLYCLWVVAVDGTVTPEILAHQTGTILEPLITEIGSIGRILGTALVVMLLGMSWLRSSSSLVNLSKGLIPARKQLSLTLSARQEKLICRTRDRYDCCSIGITYLKFNGNKFTFDLVLYLEGNIYRQEIEVDRSWDIKQLFARYPQLNRQGVDLRFEIQSVNGNCVCLEVTSSMVVSHQGWNKRAKTKIIIENGDRSNKWQQISDYCLKQSHSWYSFAPLFCVFLIAEGLLLTNQESFTKVVEFAGVLGNVLIGGIFPVLLLVASRRKGELLPGKIIKLLNCSWLLGSIYSISLLIILAHGLFIWEHPLARMSAIGVTILSITITAIVLLTEALVARTVVELVEDEETKHSLLKITSEGKPQTAKIRLGYAEGEQNHHAASVEIPALSSLRYAILEFPTQLNELKVRGYSRHNNSSIDLPLMLELNREQRKLRYDLKLFGGKVLLPIASEKCWCKLEFAAVDETI